MTLPPPSPLAVAMVRPIVYIATAPIERNEKLCEIILLGKINKKNPYT